MLALLGLGVVGAAAELVLLEHTEEIWQWIPLILLSIAVPVIIAVARAPTPPTLRALRALMILFCLAGALGLALHLKGNVEFELELHPDASGWRLIRETMMGATPALAPGAMAFLGMLGLAFCNRHPGWARR